MFELLLLALALSMDAFAVSIGLGAKHRQHTKSIAILAGVYFGVFQGVMPLIGYLFGKSVLGFIASAAPWIACIILVALGGKMLYEAFTDDDSPANLTMSADHGIEKNENGEKPDNSNAQQLPPVPHSFELNIANAPAKPSERITHKTMTTLAIATSIDAMAAGFTLNLIPINAFLACAIIAVTTAGFSAAGVIIGRQSGTWLESKAEIFGGLVLIAIGLKMVLI